MCVQDCDRETLDLMVKEYHINDILRALMEAINRRSDELVDTERKDEAKPLTLAAHHLAIFVGD